MTPLAQMDVHVGWYGQVAAALVLFVLGVLVLRALVRRRVPWWPSVAAPLLLFGPALVLVVGRWLATGEVLFGPDRAWPTNVGWSVLIFFGATAAYGIVRAFLSSRVVEEELGIRIPGLVLDAGRFLLWIVMLFVVIGAIWGRTEWFAALFTASAIGTVILGLALQETLQNFFAGMSIVTERTFAIGDWVWIGDREGEVLSISRRTTRLLTRSGDVVTIPNRTVTTSTVRNMSRPTTVHAELLYVQAPYDAPPNRVRDALRRALRDVPGVLQTPEPRLRLSKYADSGIEYEVKFWLQELSRMHDIRSDAMVQFWYHFSRAGISFPYPVREVRRLGPPAGSGIAPDALRDRLARAPLFRDVDAETLDALVRAARVESYATGERVVLQGEPGDSCYLVESGRLDVVVEDTERARSVAALAAGDLFGEMSLLTGEPRSATVRAAEDSRLVRVGAPALRDALQRSPDLANRLAEAVALRREGLAAAKTALDAETRGRVRTATARLATLIRKFFQISDRD